MYCFWRLRKQHFLAIRSASLWSESWSNKPETICWVRLRAMSGLASEISREFSWSKAGSWDLVEIVTVELEPGGPRFKETRTLGGGEVLPSFLPLADRGVRPLQILEHQIAQNQTSFQMPAVWWRLATQVPNTLIVTPGYPRMYFVRFYTSFSSLPFLSQVGNGGIIFALSVSSRDTKAVL